MTVQELIEKLQEIEDKSRECIIDDGGGGAFYDVESVFTEREYVLISRYSSEYNNSIYSNEYNNSTVVMCEEYSDKYC
jgi:hypothetical protein